MIRKQPWWVRGLSGILTQEDVAGAGPAPALTYIALCITLPENRGRQYNGNCLASQQNLGLAWLSLAQPGSEVSRSGQQPSFRL